MKNVTAVSKCLLGIPCRYNALALSDVKSFDGIDVLPVCPECELLPTPRQPCEIIGGDGYSVLGGNAKVINSLGEDVTAEFTEGAKAMLRLCIENGVEKAILKENSPSCGSTHIYDGSFSGKLKCGCGVFTALLRQNGILVVNESNLNEGSER